MSTTTFRPSACPSYWTLFLFHLTTPSIPDAWRNWLSSQEYSSPRIYAVMLTVHRSIKAIYGLVIWLIRFRSATYHHSQNSSELSRALNDGLDHQIRNARARKMYRDDEDSNEETRALLASSSNGNDPHQDTENEEHPLSNLVVWRVAWIINHSKQLQTTKLALTSDDSTDPKELTEAIVAIKNINPIFSTTLVECLKRIQSASNTRLIIEERSKLAYKTELHRDKFKELLKLLKPDQDYEPTPKGWQEAFKVGCSDSVWKVFGSIGQEIVTEAIEGGSSWYPWALASINITWWCVRLSKDRQLDYFLLIQSSCKSDDRQESLMKDIPIELYEFLILQSRLTLLFHRFWMDLKPRPSVMDFEIKFKIFQKRVQLGLRRGFIGGLGLGWILDPSSPDFTHQQTIVKF
ncbi:hypothetical protein H4Q26_009890 [Puccinia striiformis f. sp. tritici PST-130]|nr:hypothetical protein H4Q26_009890 [Puccinia striiformis f. sp. tritici PST-130]